MKADEVICFQRRRVTPGQRGSANPFCKDANGSTGLRAAGFVWRRVRNRPGGDRKAVTQQPLRVLARFGLSLLLLTRPPGCAAAVTFSRCSASSGRPFLLVERCPQCALLGFGSCISQCPMLASQRWATGAPALPHTAAGATKAVSSWGSLFHVDPFWPFPTARYTPIRQKGGEPSLTGRYPTPPSPARHLGPALFRPDGSRQVAQHSAGRGPRSPLCSQRGRLFSGCSVIRSSCHGSRERGRPNKAPAHPRLPRPGAAAAPRSVTDRE